MAELPGGSVTFLFTDIEGSTRLLGAHPSEYSAALLRHDSLLRDAVRAHGGLVFETIGDAIYAVFACTPDAIGAALDAQVALQAEDWGPLGQLRVRMAVHGGEVERRNDHYFGAPLYRCARLMAIGYGAQTLLSGAAEEASRGALPPGASLRSMGSHRLKDLVEPEQVFQLVHHALMSDFPPLKSLDARATNLPTELTSFVGRQTERREVGRLLDESRLLTLTGPGGTGKTRLALRVGTDQLARFDDGVHFVSLAQVRDPALVPQVIAHALGLQENLAEPIALSVMNHLRDRELLLVLDNFEQVVSASPLVGELLAGCQHLKVLVTSRLPLRLAAEKQYEVPPLALKGSPSAPSMRSDAVVLFLERALAFKHDLAITDANLKAIAEICTRLEGLPLSIELAAARVKVLSPQAMVPLLERRLALLTRSTQDSPIRQRSLRATIDWSYELLDETLRALFRHLAVFVGGWTIEAAESVCGADQPIPMFEEIDALVDHSLVRQESQSDGAARFVMLETIREYGLDRLTALGELADFQLRHATYFAALAEETSRAAREPKAGDGSQVQALDRLQADQGNLRAVIGWAIARKQSDVTVRLASALTSFWTLRGQATEGRMWIQSALEAGAEWPASSRAELLYRAGQLAWAQGDYARAVGSLDESVSLLKTIGDVEGQVRSLAALATARVQQGEMSTATMLAKETMTLAQQVGDERSIVLSLGVLATASLEQDDYKTAEAMFSQGLAVFRKNEDKQGVAAMLTNLGWVLLLSGDLARAFTALSEGLRFAEEIDDRRAMTFARLYLGLVAIYQGHFGAARLSLEQSIALARDLGDKQAIAECANAFGALAAVQGDARDAARFWGAAEGVYRVMGAQMGRAERTVRDRYLEGVRGKLGNDLFAVAWLEGTRLPVDDLLEEALAT